MTSIERELKAMTRKHVDEIERKLDDWFYTRATQMGAINDGDGSCSGASAEEKAVAPDYRAIKHELAMCFWKSEMPSDELVLRVKNLIDG